MVSQEIREAEEEMKFAKVVGQSKHTSKVPYRRVGKVLNDGI